MRNIPDLSINRKKSSILSILSSFLYNLIFLVLFSSAVLAQGIAQGTGNSTIDWSAVSVFVVLTGALIGWLATRRQKSKIADLMTKIDSEYASYKVKPKQCENELYRLRNTISDEFKKGKIDSSSYSILDKRIDDYLIELRERVAEEMFEGMPSKLKERLSRALEDGSINEKDLRLLTEFARTTEMSDKKKMQFERMIKEWKKEDSGEVKREEKGFFGRWLSMVPWTANRIAVFSMIIAVIVFIGGLGVLSSGNPGGIVMIAFGILTLVGGIYLKKRSPSGIKILKISYWILIIFCSLAFLTQKNPVFLIMVLVAATVVYHLKHIRVG